MDASFVQNRVMHTAARQVGAKQATVPRLWLRSQHLLGCGDPLVSVFGLHLFVSFAFAGVCLIGCRMDEEFDYKIGRASCRERV